MTFQKNLHSLYSYNTPSRENIISYFLKYIDEHPDKWRKGNIKDKNEYKRRLIEAGFSDNDACFFATLKTCDLPHNWVGVVYDIAYSDNLKQWEKDHLIRSCENYAFKEECFSLVDKNLLWKVRKCHHIRQMGLSQIAEPASFMDRLLY